MSTRDFDCIIVGAGAAGCALAGRLSENPDCRVLLIEAGPDLNPGAEPREIIDAFPRGSSAHRYAWPNLIASVGPDSGNGRGPFARQWVQGRVVGGGSSVNGMLAHRGAPTDFEEWTALGAEGWSWEEVLPYYKRLENDLDYDGPDHGEEGPIPMRRHQREEWPGFIKGIAAALEDSGLPYVPDIHASHVDSVSRAPTNSYVDRRVGAAQGYLDAAARRRQNLTIRADAMVETVILKDGCATGVRARTAAETMEFTGREIVLSAGAIQSPALLMRSGIGPGSTLAAAGIQPVLDSRGVGQGLQNHPAFHFAAHLRAGARQPIQMRSPWHIITRFSSGVSGCPPTDLAAFAVARAGWHPLGSHIGGIMAFVHKPYSRGSVTIVGPDASTMPKIDFKLLSDARDFDRLVVGAQRVLRALAHPVMQAQITECFLPTGRQTGAFAQPTKLNWMKSWTATHIFNVGAARRALLRDQLIDPAALANDKAALSHMVRENAVCVHHPTGTCRIGRSDDLDAVVDPSCRVRGIKGLRVADTSIMPTIVTAGTHLTAIMIGEKVADLLLADRGR